MVATVKGDVHDIGKNIVGVRCLQQLHRHRPRCDGACAEDPRGGEGATTPTSSASGLITPSLDEMELAVEMEWQVFRSRC